MDDQERRTRERAAASYWRTRPHEGLRYRDVAAMFDVDTFDPESDRVFWDRVCLWLIDHEDIIVAFQVTAIIGGTILLVGLITP